MGQRARNSKKRTVAWVTKLGRLEDPQGSTKKRKEGLGKKKGCPRESKFLKRFKLRGKEAGAGLITPPLARP